jgi:putative hydrolase of the HAD superfamily
MRSLIPIKAAIFDGDDTLWRTEILYDRARGAARQIVFECGLDPEKWEARQRIIDVANVSIYGFSPKRFPASCIQALEEVQGVSGAQVGEVVRAKIVDAATSVFRNTPELVPQAASVLEELQDRGVRLALLTKGDATVQTNRVEGSGLARFFDVIEIVPEKTPLVIKGLLRKLGVQKSNCWIIGNSLRSDILPAIEVGVKGIWIDMPVWEYERADVILPEALYYKVSDLPAVLGLIR